MPSLKNDYDENGYVIVDGLIAPGDFAFLEQACQRAISRTRSGEWKHRRTVGKQFPPYGDEDPDSWGVQHVMHPELGEDAFAKWYTSEPLTQVITQLMDCKEDDLQMGEPHLETYKPIDSESVTLADNVDTRAIQSLDQPFIPRLRLAMA